MRNEMGDEDGKYCSAAVVRLRLTYREEEQS